MRGCLGGGAISYHAEMALRCVGSCVLLLFVPSCRSHCHAFLTPPCPSSRILLHAIDTAANRYKKYVVPWVSVSVDFYVRLFVRVYQVPSHSSLLVDMT